MLRHGRRMHNYRMAELCDVAVIPMLEVKYYERLKNYHLALARDPDDCAPAPVVHRPALDAGTTESRDVFFSLFQAKKGIRH